MSNVASALVATVILAFSTFSAVSQELRGSARLGVVEATGVRVIKTDPQGIALNKVLGLKANVGTLKGTKCFHCTGTPTHCKEIPCDVIVIVDTDD
jgi:hypothetical protein